MAISSGLLLCPATQPAISILPKPLVVSFNLFFKAGTPLALSSTCPNFSASNLATTSFANAAPTVLSPKSLIAFNTLAISSGLLLCSATHLAISILPASVRLPVPPVSTNMFVKLASLSSFPKFSESIACATNFVLLKSVALSSFFTK